MLLLSVVGYLSLVHRSSLISGTQFTIFKQTPSLKEIELLEKATTSTTTSPITTTTPTALITTTGTTHILNLSVTEVVQVSSADSNPIWKDGTYYKPKEKNFQFFDSLYYHQSTKTLVGIQHTVSPTSKQQFDIPGAKKEYVNDNSVKELLIVFVVPFDIAPTFKFPSKFSSVVNVVLLPLPM